MFICPVNECPWRHEQTKPSLETMVWRQTIQESVAATIARDNRRDEATIRAHLAEHPVEDFARTIVELRNELDELRSSAAPV